MKICKECGFANKDRALVCKNCSELLQQDSEQSQKDSVNNSVNNSANDSVNNSHNLGKGERISLSKEAPSLKKVGVGLGWDTNSTDTGEDFDLDASVFMLGANSKVPKDEYFVFYNNLTSPDGSVKHTGDNLTGSGDGDAETIQVELSKVDSAIQEMVFVATIHDAEIRKQNFGQVRNAYIRLYDQETGKEVAKYDLDEDFSREVALEFGRLYKKNGEWRFHAVGQGFNSGLQSFVDKYIG